MGNESDCHKVRDWKWNASIQDRTERPPEGMDRIGTVHQYAVDLLFSQENNIRQLNDQTTMTRYGLPS